MHTQTLISQPSFLPLRYKRTRGSARMRNIAHAVLTVQILSEHREVEVKTAAAQVVYSKQSLVKMR